MKREPDITTHPRDGHLIGALPLHGAEAANAAIAELIAHFPPCGDPTGDVNAE